MLKTTERKLGKVLIVDDDKNLLQSIKRNLHSVWKDYDIRLLDDGSEACELIEHEKFDLIVSDLMMPGVNGIQVVETARESNPQAMRVLISGQDDKKVMTASLHAAHRYISKPCASADLLEMIEKACYSRKKLHNIQLRKVISDTEILPSQAHTIIQLKKELSKKIPDVYKLSEIFSGDVVLAARLYQLMGNSSFGMEGNIYDFKDVINYISIEKLKSFAFDSNLLKSSYDLNVLFSIDQFTIESRSVAIRTQWLAETQYLGMDDAKKYYVAGFLHNIGKLIMASSDFNGYMLCFLMQRERGGPNLSAEYETFGASYAEIGAEHLMHWGVPKLIVQSIEKQNNINTKLYEESQVIALAIRIAKDMVAGVRSDNDARLFFSRKLEDLDKEKYH